MGFGLGMREPHLRSSIRVFVVLLSSRFVSSLDLSPDARSALTSIAGSGLVS
jgi:hypothetical protein